MSLPLATTAGPSIGGLARPAARASGPLAAIALVAFIASLVVTGGDALELATSPVSIVASLAGLTVLVALSIGMASLVEDLPVLRSGAGRVGWVVAAVGTILAAGGQWAQLFVLPGIAGPAPDLATDGIASVVAGYIASYIVLAVGWLVIGVTLLRSGAVSRRFAWGVIVGALLCVPPLPVRFVFVAVAVSLLTRASARDRG